MVGKCSTSVLFLRPTLVQALKALLFQSSLCVLIHLFSSLFLKEQFVLFLFPFPLIVPGMIMFGNDFHSKCSLLREIMVSPVPKSPFILDIILEMVGWVCLVATASS